MNPVTARILVVDDEPAIGRALTIALERDGYRALAADTTEFAIRQLREAHWDLMVLDLRMPGMRGDAFYALATGLQPHLKHRTLFLTGDMTERAEDLIGACGCPMLLKPFDLRQVMDALRRMIPRREHSARA